MGRVGYSEWGRVGYSEWGRVGYSEWGKEYKWNGLQV